MSPFSPGLYNFLKNHHTLHGYHISLVFFNLKQFPTVCFIFPDIDNSPNDHIESKHSSKDPNRSVCGSEQEYIKMFMETERIKDNQDTLEKQQ